MALITYSARASIELVPTRGYSKRATVDLYDSLKRVKEVALNSSSYVIGCACPKFHRLHFHETMDLWNGMTQAALRLTSVVAPILSSLARK